MLRWFDGLEQYGVIAHMTEGVGGGAAWSQVDSGWTLITTNPATQTYHLRLTDTSSPPRQIRRVFGEAKQVVGFGYRFNVEELPSAEPIDDNGGYGLELANFRDVANTSHCHITLGTDGAVIFRRGNTEIGRSDPCIAPGGYHHFEAKVKIDNSTGYVEVRVNEVTVLNLTGIDTQNSANATAAQVSVGLRGSVSTGAVGFSTCDFDDFFAWDDDNTDAENTIVDFIGDKGVYWLPVNADTAEADWTKSTGVTGYTLIDEIPPSGGTDYIADTTGAARSIFGVSDLPANVAELIAVMPVIMPRKEDSGSVTMRGGIVVNGQESYGPDDSPSTAYAYLRPAPKTIDPDTGVAWANDAEPELLIERTA